jgi:hypothetical protein
VLFIPVTSTYTPVPVEDQGMSRPKKVQSDAVSAVAYRPTHISSLSRAGNTARRFVSRRWLISLVLLENALIGPIRFGKYREVKPRLAAESLCRREVASHVRTWMAGGSQQWR